MHRSIYALVPGRFKPAMKRLYYLPVDIYERIAGKRDPFVPPRGLINIGSGDFIETGKTFFRYFVEFCELEPDEAVLDIGCGIGRMAGPLAKYLTGDGSYEGIDIVESNIRWCRRNITPRRPAFRFSHIDIYNKTYNPKGKCIAAEYRFPFDDGSFDFIYLTSVFSHMLRDDMLHYLSEIHRMLTENGRCLATYFLLNTESRDLMEKGNSTRNFAHDLDGCYTTDVSEPEAAVAYDEGFVYEALHDLGFPVVEPVRYGSWSGRTEHTSYQDIVIFRKR